MARLKSLDAQITFDIDYNNRQPHIFQNGKRVKDVLFQITSVTQSIAVVFKEFEPGDKAQKVKIHFNIDGKPVNIQHLCKFQAQNNQYLADHTIENYDEIFLNGTLHITLNPELFETNLLGGMRFREYLSTHAVSVDQQEVFCIGDSRTVGGGLPANETWPGLLAGKVANFGYDGISHKGCLINVEYILKHSSKVKRIICLLPAESRQTLDFNFLDKRLLHNIFWHNVPECGFAPVEDQIKECTKQIMDEQRSRQDWIDSCNQMIDACDTKGVECLISTWDEQMYKHIPQKNRLPMFPPMEMFVERAPDGRHPHRKHYQLFVNNINSCVDKNQN